MPKEYLAGFPESERLSLLQLSLLERCEQLGDTAVALRDMPGQLQTEKAQLEAKLRQMLDAEAERERLAALNDPHSAEKIALRQLDEARAELEHKDAELHRMERALHAAQDSVIREEATNTELRRELAAERAELHKLRQEKRVTQLPARVVSDLPVHTSPRQSEHPELTSPRQALRQQQRAASASMRRERGMGGGGGAGLPPRPFSARPAMADAALNDFGRSPYAASSAPSSPPAAGAGAAAHAAGATPQSRGTIGSGSGGALHRPILHAPPYQPAPSRHAPTQPMRPGMGGIGGIGLMGSGRGVDMGTQTSGGDLERQLKELTRANGRLQTALLAAALGEPDRHHGHHSARGGSVTTGLHAWPQPGATRGLLPQQMAAYSAALGRAGAPPSDERPWPFPPGKSAKGLAAWPPMA